MLLPRRIAFHLGIEWCDERSAVART